MDERVLEIRKQLKKKLEPYRFEHTLGVEFTCQALAMRYGYDLKKAKLAGLLHDCAKRYDGFTMLKKCLDRCIPVTEAEMEDSSLLHAKLGAWMAENKYLVDDKEILSAIACHTTGKPGMSLLDKILYVADYIEPGRDRAENLPQMRSLAFQDLDAACLAIMESSLKYLESTGHSIDPMTSAACADMRRIVQMADAVAQGQPEGLAIQAAPGQSGGLAVQTTLGKPDGLAIQTTLGEPDELAIQTPQGQSDGLAVPGAPGEPNGLAIPVPLEQSDGPTVPATVFTPEHKEEHKIESVKRNGKTRRRSFGRQKGRRH